jgi:hypothetical protein
MSAIDGFLSIADMMAQQCKGLNLSASSRPSESLEGKRVTEHASCMELLALGSVIQKSIDGRVCDLQ